MKQEERERRFPRLGTGSEYAAPGRLSQSSKARARTARCDLPKGVDTSDKRGDANEAATTPYLSRPHASKRHSAPMQGANRRATDGPTQHRSGPLQRFTRRCPTDDDEREVRTGWQPKVKERGRPRPAYPEWVGPGSPRSSSRCPTIHCLPRGQFIRPLGHATSARALDGRPVVGPAGQDRMACPAAARRSRSLCRPGGTRR